MARTSDPESLKEAARLVLLGTQDPESGRDLVAAGRVADLLVTAAGRVLVALVPSANSPRTDETLRAGLEAELAALSGAVSARVVLAAATAATPSQAEPEASGATRRVRKGARLSDEALRQSGVNSPAGKGRAELARLPHVRAVVAVASAKGGVGKSTVAVNLACACAQLGLRVGLLDADVYGPSVPLMLGLSEAEPAAGPGGKLMPLRAWGVDSMSMGYLVDADAPMIWRGPIIMSALTQFLNDVAWGSKESPLDVLFLDTPPGTGDALLTLAQRAPLSGVVIVSTPQEAALADVRRGVAMFRKTDVPVLGIIENMAWFEDPTGQRHHIFGDGGAQALAADLGVRLLAALPLDPVVREGADAGRPVVAAEPGSPAAQRFLALADGVMAELARTLATLKPSPEILFVD
jgi:ATP-binding protein involved in chromosome partitioning